MRALPPVVSTFALCLLACACGSDRNAPASQHGAAFGSDSAASRKATAQVQPVVIDTRSPQEYASGHLDGALSMPYDAIGGLIEAQVPDKDTPVLLYCRSGGRAEMARKTLVAMKYTKVENLGGIRDAADKLGKGVVK